ncbi:MAG: methyltransferase domain-containing protein [Pseudomonadota bacterium]|nr:methyltransferase domain-containing protein [Pseudomonadota bacterium]
MSLLGAIPRLSGRLSGRLVGRRWLLWQARRAYVRDWGTVPLLVLPGVLDPVATKVGEWLASVAAAHARPGERWVDMGCGTGIVGLALAERGAVVTAIDIDPVCVRNARANAALLGRPVDVVESDLFAALPAPERRFDRVVYNVPFWPGDPSGRPFGRAMYAGADFAAIRAFVAAFPAHADEAWVVLSEHGGDFAGAHAALGPCTLVRREHVRGEWLSLYALRPQAP